MDQRPDTMKDVMAILAQKHPDFIWPTLFDYAELKKEASERALKIFEHWNNLHDTLERHEATLRRRWSKKSTEQRKRILLVAWPDMPVTHRPDIQAQKRETPKQREEKTAFRDAYLLPYINLEDLTQSRPLLLLLNSRGHNLPHKFASNELKSARVGLNSGAISRSCLHGYKMFLEDQITPETYGQLRSLEEDTNGRGMEPGNEILVLEIQQRLLRFLELCTELILHDLPLHDMTAPVQQSAPLDENPGWPSLAKTLAEAPYLLPDACDFRYLQAFIHAKRAESMDHMWLLREDPAYFREVVYDWFEHRDDNVPSAEGKTQPFHSEAIGWQRATSSVLASAYNNLLHWNLAHDEFSKLWARGTQDGLLFLDNKSIVDSSRIAYTHFSYLLAKMRISILGDLKAGVFASPPLRKHYIRALGGSNSTDIQITRRHPTRRDYLLILVDALTEWRLVSLYGLHTLLDELERILQSDAKQRSRISTWVAHIISDLTIVAELERQMSLYQPEPVEKLLHEGLTENLMHQEYTKRTPIILIVNHGIGTMRLSSGECPLRNCHYPSDKPRTAQRTREMIDAERILDAFWNKVDEHFVEQTGKTLHELTRSAFPKAEWARKLQRTPEWSQPILKPTQGGAPYEATKVACSALEQENRPQSALPTDGATLTKAKVKTRRQDTVSAEAVVEARVPAPSTTPPTISVHKRAYKTFTTLFYTPDNDGQPGEISWLDFLQAMSSVGFAVQKLDGSAWMFKPQDEVQRGIIFHEPHPHGKIPLHVARRHGRRLQKAYGWTGETFTRA